MVYLARYLCTAIGDCPPPGRSQTLRPTINFFDYGTLRATWAKFMLVSCSAFINYLKAKFTS